MKAVGKRPALSRRGPNDCFMVGPDSVPCRKRRTPLDFSTPWARAQKIVRQWIPVKVAIAVQVWGGISRSDVLTVCHLKLKSGIPPQRTPSSASSQNIVVVKMESYLLLSTRLLVLSTIEEPNAGHLEICHTDPPSMA